MTFGRVVVMGFGVTGRAVARALRAVGDPVTVLDDRLSEELLSAGRALGVDLEPVPGDPELDRLLLGTDMVVPSPGVPVWHPVLAASARLGVPVRSEIELAWRLRRPDGPALAAVTGTNGKTTVTTLATAMISSSGLRARAAGNIGDPMIDALRSDVDVVVGEVSSFQLQFTDRFRPAVSCWLNLAPDHLDWHPTHAHYRDAKARVWANQSDGDVAIFNCDDAEVAAAARAIPCRVARRSFGLLEGSDYRLAGGRLVGPGGLDLAGVDELPRSFPHDLENSLAASAVALATGATPEGCRRALLTTGPLPHRLAVVGVADGLTWYDDAKATTPASVLAAVKGFSSVVLIAGGRNKGLDLAALASTVPPVHAVVAIGEAREEVRRVFGPLVPVSAAADMTAAVAAARRLGRRGDAILLSPGCASFDWYPSYSARGDDFARAVQACIRKGEPKC